MTQSLNMGLYKADRFIFSFLYKNSIDIIPEVEYNENSIDEVIECLLI